ncbi:MAG: hypothetical protein P8173_15915 [Gammaproteobacteria bacterium]
MSEPTDPNPPDPKDDKAVSSLYARGSTEQPSDALNQAILDKARKATASHAARTHRFSGWPGGISVAAVLVISVLVVMLVREEAPEPLSTTSRPAVVQEEKATATPSKTLPAPQERPAERRQAEAPAAQSNETPRALTDRLALNKEEKDQRQHPVEDGALGKATTAAPATAPAQESMAPGAARGDVRGFTSEGKVCAQMTEQECLSSAACTLTKNETTHGYQCRFAKDYCELLFRQSAENRESCEAKTGCVYVPASCYCPPDVKCECSGGEPAQCQRRQ